MVPRVALRDGGSIAQHRVTGSDKRHIDELSCAQRRDAPSRRRSYRRSLYGAQATAATLYRVAQGRDSEAILTLSTEFVLGALTPIAAH